jgi:hypothetical protein
MTEETEMLQRAAVTEAGIPGDPPQTTVATSTTHPMPESHICGITIRAWLAVMVVATMCIIALYQVWKTGVIDESFKVAYGLVIGLYFGQKK